MGRQCHALVQLSQMTYHSNFNIKTIALKQCVRCGSSWSTERIALEPHDKVEIVTVRIAYCPACSEGFAAEIDRPGYEKSTRKRIQ